MMWGAEQASAFKQIKQRLIQADVLAHYNPNVPVQMHRNMVWER